MCIKIVKRKTHKPIFISTFEAVKLISFEKEEIQVHMFNDEIWRFSSRLFEVEILEGDEK